MTSPLPGDGKTTIALNLATVLAEERERKSSWLTPIFIVDVLTISSG